MDKSKSFISLLKKLNYDIKELQEVKTNHYRYLIINKIINQKIFIDYLYIPSNDLKNNLYQKQNELWNENLLNSYIVFSENKTYTFNAKQKPDPDPNKLFKSKINDFSYGVNTPEIEELKKYISKDKIDSGYYFQFIKDRIKKIEEVDKDLLENIIAVYNDLKNISEFSFSLIFKCIFIKFLEDRNFIDSNLIKILKSGSPNELIQKFNYMKKINGDIFNDEPDLKSLNEQHVEKLYNFFISDYKRGQAYLFPYKFDKIPIELLSNVYENFVDKEIKKKQGVYYTPIFIIDFILGFTVKEKLKDSIDIKILDPSCGSGSFLVESYKKIIENYEKNEQIDIIKKIKILQKLIFGIDIDEEALEIASFSLYLALFEGEDPNDIKKMIKENKIRLPNLINKNLIKADSLTDLIFKDIKFDCIIGNPPWGSNEKYKKIINNDYKNKISDYQQSQIFLLKVINWANDKTTIAMIVNNSNFYNLNAEKFRKEFLKTYDLYYYFELSKMKEIFENADYPSAILIFNKTSNIENEIKYISVYQDKLAEFLKIITYCEKDIKKIKQQDLIEEDILWRIFVNGNWEDYQLIKRKWIERDKKITITCKSGLKPKKNMKEKETKNLKKIIDLKNIESYFINEQNLEDFNLNQEGFERSRKKNYDFIFKGERLLLKAVPDSDNLRLISAFTDKEIIHKHNILSLKINKITDYKSYLAILNSSFIGYFLYNISPQWGKGKKQEILRNKDIEKWLSFPDINYSDKKIINLIQLVDEIENLKSEKYNNNQLFNDYDNKIKKKEKQIDRIVYGLYNLKTYEIDLIEDFFLINQDRKNDVVNHKDIEKYIKKFRESFSLVLEKKYYINVVSSIVPCYGVYVCFEIVNINNKKEKVEKQNSNIFNLINNNKKDEFINWSLFKMDKKKIYDNNKLYIIKSNYLKDWTKTEARKDASEEIGEFFKKLPRD